jgi:hypothetical protein
MRAGNICLEGRSKEKEREEMTLFERKRKIAALKRINERKRTLKEASKTESKTEGSKTVRIRMSELKKLIREEARRARVLKEQGRPVSIPLGRPTELADLETGRGRPKEEGGQYYSSDEFIDYVRAGLKSGRGRPQEYDVDLGDEMLTLSDRELLSAYDEDGQWYDIYSTTGENLAKIPLNLDSLEQ